MCFAASTSRVCIRYILSSKGLVSTAVASAQCAHFEHAIALTGWPRISCRSIPLPLLLFQQWRDSGRCFVPWLEDVSRIPLCSSVKILVSVKEIDVQRFENRLAGSEVIDHRHRSEMALVHVPCRFAKTSFAFAFAHYRQRRIEPKLAKIYVLSYMKVKSTAPLLCSMASRSPSRLIVLISGSGTNLQALIDSFHTPSHTDTDIVRVISDRKDAYGLKRAEAATIPTTHHGILPYRKRHPAPDGETPADAKAREVRIREAYDKDLAELVLSDEPDLVVCAGFMRIVSDSFLQPLQERKVPIINLHPSLHGDLVGAHCIERAWAEFEAGTRKKTGIMIHYVISEVDKGEMIVQQGVDIEGCKTLGDLQERIHSAEHRLIVEGTRRVLETVRGGQSS